MDNDHEEIYEYYNSTGLNTEVLVSSWAFWLLFGVFLWVYCIIISIMKFSCLPTCLHTCMQRRKLNKYNFLPDTVMNDICPICIDGFNKEQIILKLYCNHIYHRECLEMWIIDNNNNECPTCRGKIIL